MTYSSEMDSLFHFQVFDIIGWKNGGSKSGENMSSNN